MANESDTLKQLAQVRAEAKEKVGGKKDEELPTGTAPIVEAAASGGEKAPEETPAESPTPPADGGAAEPPPAPAEAAEEKVRIGDRTFDTQAEAWKYAEGLERERLLSEAHSAGVREAIEAQVRTQPAPAAPDPAELDAEFYRNPQAAIARAKEEATQTALTAMKAEMHKEKLWGEFLNEYPDIRRKDAERILLENMKTIGAVTDVAAGKKLLAAKVRDEYTEIESLRTPRTTLSSKKPVVSPSGSSGSGVTQPPKEEKILRFSDQLRSLRKSN